MKMDKPSCFRNCKGWVHRVLVVGRIPS